MENNKNCTTIYLLLPLMLGLLATVTEGVAVAQSFSETSVSVLASASVQSDGIDLITVESINLSEAERVQNQIRINPVTSGYAGKMVASGASNATFRITYDPVKEMVNVDQSGILLVEYSVAGNPIDEQETAELFNMENRELAFNAEGKYYLWVGGTIDLSQATPGAYEGEFTIEIEYN